MKTENQVCSFEQAKKLKELGIDQKSYFDWLEVSNGDDEGDHTAECVEWHPVLCVENSFTECLMAVGDVDPEWTTSDGEFCGMRDTASAFNVAELAQMRNSETCTMRTGSELSKYANWDWPDDSRSKAMGPFPTQAYAAADLLIHLLDKNLVTAEEANQRLALP